MRPMGIGVWGTQFLSEVLGTNKMAPPPQFTGTFYLCAWGLETFQNFVRKSSNKGVQYLQNKGAYIFY